MVYMKKSEDSFVQAALLLSLCKLWVKLGWPAAVISLAANTFTEH